MTGAELLAKASAYDGHPICPRCGDGFPVCVELRRAGVDLSAHGVPTAGCGCPFYEWAGDVCPQCSDEMDREVNAPDPDPETLCTVCGNDTPTVRCCGQPLDYDRNM